MIVIYGGGALRKSFRALCSTLYTLENYDDAGSNTQRLDGVILTPTLTARSAEVGADHRYGLYSAEYVQEGVTGGRWRANADGGARLLGRGRGLSFLNALRPIGPIFASSPFTTFPAGVGALKDSKHPSISSQEGFARQSPVQ